MHSAVVRVALLSRHRATLHINVSMDLVLSDVHERRFNDNVT